ncbi:MAG TPA: hypothetical protein PKC28_12365, partial [Bdellovibrionales bacterium]|nr:hypothetical protein [Bdellovibrionales bacterium]
VMERTFDVADLSAATESGFVLPKDTLQGVVGFLYENGELGYRLSSFKVEAFTRLMQNRFIQFFVWPDLMKFARNAEFFFDLRTERAPVLTNGRMSSAGLHYSLQAPVLVQQWAPGSKAYVPYADFRANANGDLVTRVQNHKMTLSLAIPRLDIKTKFRSEYSLLRRINQRISSGLLGSRVADYLNDNPFSLEIPSWQVGEGLSLGIKGAQSWKQSFRVPLEFAH